MLNIISTEAEAANEVSSIMERTGRIIANIPTKEKGISWDGELSIFNESVVGKKNIPKDTFLYKIPVQVKGTEVKSFEGFLPKHNFNISDFNNYLKDGGVILFLGAIKLDKTSYEIEKKIFYSSLLPLDLINIIEYCKDNQYNSKTIKFKELPKNPIELLKILDSFDYNKKKQPSILLKNNMNIKKIDGFKVQLKNLDGNFVLGEEAYIYGECKDVGIDVPLTVAKLSKIQESKNINIEIGDKTFFNRVDRYFDEYGNIKVVFGDKITFEYRSKLDKLTFNFTVKGSNIETAINTIRFILSLHKTKSFKMNSIELNINLDELGMTFIEALNKDLKKLERAKAVFNYFNISLDIDINKYNSNIYDETLLLYTAIILEQSVIVDSKENIVIIKRCLMDNDILLLGIKESDGSYKLFDFFKNIEQKIGSFYKENGEFKLITPYISLDVEDINSINFNENIVMESILKHKYDDNVGNGLNLLVLRIIEAFDKYSCDHLELALNILEYLQAKDFDKDILLINKAQILKRKDIRLNDEIIERLLFIRDSNGYEFKCCVEILFNNKISFNHYFNKLDREKQENFKSYPIYTLIEKN